MNPTNPNPRRFTRVTCNAAAMVAYGDSTFAGVCENISVGGAFFKGASLPSLTEVHMMLCLPSIGPIEVLGEVRHAHEDGFGLRFKRVESRGLMAICTFVGTIH